MSGFDWLIIAIIIVSVVLAASQGFFFELFSLAGAVIGYLLAAWEYKRVALWFLPYVKNEWAADSAAFLAIFLSVVILAGMIGRVARWAVTEVGLRWFDRFLGGVFGALRGALIVMVVVLAMASFGPGSRALANSSLAPYFLVLGRGAMWASPYELREKFRAGLKALSDMHDAHGTPATEKSSAQQPSGEKK